jgi:hypothetical protein
MSQPTGLTARVPRCFVHILEKPPRRCSDNSPIEFKTKVGVTLVPGQHPTPNELIFDNTRSISEWYYTAVLLDASGYIKPQLICAVHVMLLCRQEVTESNCELPSATLDDSYHTDLVVRVIGLGDGYETKVCTCTTIYCTTCTCSTQLG